MGVTRFESVVAAQTIGTADVEKLSASFEKLSGSIDNAGKNADKIAQHPGFESLAEKIKAGIENPLQAAGSAVEGLLKAWGPMGTAIAGGAAIFTATAAAGFEAAKALGEYGLRVRDVELRTGLAAKEVGQYGFAAKAVGQDVSILDRLMRGLSMAVEDSSAKGEKARTWMAKWGVDMVGLKNGTASTSEALMKVGVGLEELPAGVERSAAAIDVFKRAGIEAIPFLVELNKNLGIARDLDFGSSEEKITRMASYVNQVAQLETKWASLTRSFKEPLASTLMVTIKGVLGDNADVTVAAVEALKGQIGKLSPDGAQKRLDLLARSGMVAAPTVKELQDKINASADKGLFAGAGFGSEQWQTSGIRVLGHETQNAAHVDLSNLTQQISTALESPGDKGKLEDATKKLRELQSTLKEGQQLGLSLVKQQDIASQVEQQKAVVAGIEAQAKASKDLAEAERALQALRSHSAESYSHALGEGEGGPLGKYNATLAKISIEREDFQRRFPRVSSGGAFAVQESAAATIYRAEVDKLFAEFDKKGEEIGRHWVATLEELGAKTVKTGEDLFREHPEIFGTNARPFLTGMSTPEQALRDARDNERRGVSLYGARAGLAGVGGVDQANTMERLRQKYADDEYAALERIAHRKNDEQAKQDAADQWHQKYLDAEIERQQTLLELALRQKQEFQSLMVGGLDALISGGGAAFLKSQGMHLLDSVVGNAAGMAWGSVSKVIPHASGTMGKLLEGTMFGADPAKAATDANTMATIDNTNALRSVAMSRGSGGGSTGAGIYTGGGARWSVDGGVPGYDPENPDMITPEGAAWGDAAWANTAGHGMSNLSKGMGVAGLAAGGGFGIYSGIKAGGAQGALTAAGSAAGMAGGIVSMLLPKLAGTLGPIGMALGMGLGLVSTLLGDPKKNRANDLSTQAQERAFTMPSGADYSMDANGRYADYNYRGQVRSTTINQNIYAMDSTTFRDYLLANPSALSTGITSALATGNGSDMVGQLSRNLGLNS